MESNHKLWLCTLHIDRDSPIRTELGAGPWLFEYGLRTTQAHTRAADLV